MSAERKQMLYMLYICVLYNLVFSEVSTWIARNAFGFYRSIFNFLESIFNEEFDSESKKHYG